VVAVVIPVFMVTSVHVSCHVTLQKSLSITGRHAGQSGGVGITQSSVKLPISYFKKAGFVAVAFCGLLASANYF
jgi:hypothetical protein